MINSATGDLGVVDMRVNRVRWRTILVPVLCLSLGSVIGSHADFAKRGGGVIRSLRSSGRTTMRPDAQPSQSNGQGKPGADTEKIDLSAGLVPIRRRSGERIPVFFSCDCSDAVGSLVATKIRDLLARSPRFIEAAKPIEEDTNYKAYAWSLDIVSVDSQGEQGHQYTTALAAAFTVGERFYITSSIQVCGRDRVAGCASQFVAELDQEIKQTRDYKPYDGIVAVSPEDLLAHLESWEVEQGGNAGH